MENLTRHRVIGAVMEATGLDRIDSEEFLIEFELNVLEILADGHTMDVPCVGAYALDDDAIDGARPDGMRSFADVAAGLPDDFGLGRDVIVSAIAAIESRLRASDADVVHVPVFGNYGLDDKSVEAADRAERLDEAERLGLGGGRIWLFQLSADSFDADGPVDELDWPIVAWAASQHRDEIEIGDRVIAWVGGEGGGVYGLGYVNGPRLPGQSDGALSVDAAGENTIASIVVTVDLSQQPISRTRLAAHAEWDDPSAMVPIGVDPHPVTEETWSAITRELR